MIDNNLLKYGFLIGLVTSVFFFSKGCTEEITELTRENKILADSIFREQEKLLKIEIDSLCKLGYQDAFDRAVDSIAAIRLREIEEINNR